MMIKACAVQITSRQNISENIDKVTHFAEKACLEKSDIIVLPEMFPYFGEAGSEIHHAVSEKDAGRYIKPLIKLSESYGNIIVCGSIPVISDSPPLVYNRSYTAYKGDIIGFYDKINLFDIELSGKAAFLESSYTRPGSSSKVFELPDFSLGVSICFDLRFPSLFSGIRRKGADVLAVPAAFLEHTGKDHWEVLLRARAIENQMYVIASNQYGRHYKNRKTYGRSMIIDAWGTVLACAPDTETNIYAELDFESQKKIRRELKIF